MEHTDRELSFLEQAAQKTADWERDRAAAIKLLTDGYAAYRQDGYGKRPQ